jgi:hypothetical protein
MEGRQCLECGLFLNVNRQLNEKDVSLMLILIVKYRTLKNQLIQSTPIIKILPMKLAVVILEAELILSCLARSHKVKD